MSEIQTNPEMNEEIKDILRLGNEPFDLYAAQRIEELEEEVQRLKPCDDAISREATLKPYNGLNDEDTISVWLIRKNIEQQPPVNLQPKTGHWIIKENRHVKCSRCLVVHPHSSIFCPSCGAMMIE